MPTPAYDQARLEAAIEALAEPGRLAEAESLVAGAAPKLQQVLLTALQAGDWFGEAHEGEVRRASELDDPDERRTAVRTLLAEEARMGMMVGVAVGWALRDELNERTQED